MLQLAHFLPHREVVECGRKLLLTGFSMFFGVGSIMQAVLGILVTLLYVVAVSHLSPYDDTNGPSNNQLAVVDHCALLVLLLQVVMIKYHIAVESISTPAYEPGYSASFVNAVLVCTLAATGLFSGVAMAAELMRTEAPGAGPENGAENVEGMSTAALEEGSGSSTNGDDRDINAVLVAKRQAMRTVV